MRKFTPIIVIGIGLNLISVSSSVVLIEKQGSIWAPLGPETEICVVPRSVEFPAPELTLIDTEGASATHTDHIGTVVLANAWAS